MGSFRIRFVLGLIALSLGRVSGAVDTDSFFFRHYKSDGSHNDVNINEVDQLRSEWNFDECTMLHIHGYRESVDAESVTIIVDAYLKVTKCNVIAIDYRKVADNINYIADAIHVNAVGAAIANALDQLVAHGLDCNKVHIVGHSLGAQVAGHVGIHINCNISRITGLDSAGPMFYTGRYLKSGDAQFVDMIHTDKGVLGQMYNSADADFLPNGGHRPQPGCPVLPFEKTKENEEYCNHHRSWRYYAESVLNPYGFMAIQCANSLQFDIGECNRANVVPMGYATPTSARGKFYLHTNSQSPFAEGMKGI
ncbi:inactive pancreatic lipase-related protein 1-like [Lasioglossum baleicum]|uniref:inactive pancreatic lipase-related protein 1-like n=1 Tax=Lasioglossum baleicum TaxID=434251 RepID=UPI003FCC4D28